MTKEDAINLFKEWLYAGIDINDNCFRCLRVEEQDAVMMAIFALEQEPCDECKYKTFTELYFHTDPEMVEQEPCEDAISRDAVLDTTICEGISCNECSFNEIDGESGCLLHARIDELPPVTPSRRKGHWRKTPKAVMGEGYMWYCDNCEYEVYQDSSRDYPSEKFCPNCGAEMGDAE